MASGLRSGANRELDGFQVPRKSNRGRKPKTDDIYFQFNTPSPRPRGLKNAGTKNGPRVQQARPISVRPKQRKHGNRGQTMPIQSESSDTESNFSDDYSTSDTLDNLEERVHDLTRATGERMSDLEFLVKLIFNALPQETVQNLRNYARTSEKRGTIEDFLSDMTGLDNANTQSRGTIHESSNSGLGYVGLRGAGGPGRGTGGPGAAAAAAASGPISLPPPSVRRVGDEETARAAQPVTRAPRTPPLSAVPDARGGNQLDANRRTDALRDEQALRDMQMQAMLREGRLREERKKNIVVKGLREDLPDGDEGAVSRMLHAMDLGHLKSRDCGARRVGRGSSSRPRLLIVSFQHERYAKQILMDKIKLLWTRENNMYGNFSDVFIDPDMTREERQAEFANRRDERMARENNPDRGDGQMNNEMPRNGYEPMLEEPRRGRGKGSRMGDQLKVR